jgi:hypothetical protein
LSAYFISIEVKCSFSVFGIKNLIGSHSPPSSRLIGPSLVSEPVNNILSLIRSKSMKATWNVVLASHRSSMGQTTRTGRFVCQYISRVQGSCSEPQLGMVVSQFKRGIDGPGLGFVAKDESVACFGKVGECSGLKLLVTCSQLLWIKNKGTHLLYVKDLRLSKHHSLSGIMNLRRRS